ncbi:MAG: tRNA threonylcarbamoyladenosine dehydratase [Alphaproteobacteria bacterium]|nr:tRNA threonylcarbamoyladenosine dehydratase [Alphaproteobacteria bacterium]
MSEDRFMRTSQLLGEISLDNIRQSTVMIIGVGAVGGYAMEALARAGVGHLILVDFDKVEISNINRQIIALDSTVGQFKTEAAANRIKDINPNCHVETHNIFVSGSTLPQLLSTRVDYVVDAIDSLDAKCELIKELWWQKIPFVSSMGAALKTDASAIRLAPLSKSQNCTLAKKIRHNLRQQGVELSEIMCVYSQEQPVQISAHKPKTLGSLPTITAIFGLMIANHIILQLANAQK